MSEAIDTASDFGKVAVLMGGRAAERDISLKSGAAVLRALQARGVQAEAVDTGEDAYVQRLLDGGFERAFNALHGRGGEDGVIQGLLESLGIAFTGSGVLGSALAMDKLRTKQLWQGMGLPTPAFALLSCADDLRAVPETVGFPLMLKPVHEGSSIGMSKVCEARTLEAAWQEAARYDSDVLAEAWIEGSEYTAAVVAETALPLIRLETPREFYDYQAKYEADTTRYHCPCGLAPDDEKALQGLARQAFTAVAAGGWGRVDFMLDAGRRPWLIEVNTVPGMTDHSLVPMAAEAFGWDMPELCWKILETSLGNRA